MKLHLQLHTSSQGQAKAAFLRGKDPALWLQQIQSWSIHPRNLEAYSVPYSIRDREIAGLLVVLKQGHFPEQLELPEAYRCMGSALLIPQYCSIQPQIAETEWPNILHYDWHFYHPGIGMVGFQRSDQFNLINLLIYPAAQEQNWSLAQPGPAQPPALQHMSVQMPAVEEIFAQVEGVGDQSLQDIPEKPAQTDDEKPGDLRLNLLNSLNQILRQRGQIREGESQGILGKWLDRLQGGIQQKIRDLHKQREDEISRLLKLFEEDPEEALRYSIPLHSPYEGRGIAPPSDTLGRKDPLDFNLGQLGSTGPRDNWDIDNQRRIALQQYYLKLANQKIAEKDFRKAAYIHAHLLGDFNTAANVLMQGKHYHEAALLYRDHLKNLQQAARCFEEGGLYSEAIDLYLKVGEKEKAGDLYLKIDQWPEAKKLYQDCVEDALKALNHLEAARIYEAKLNDRDRAKSSLLLGWHSKEHPIACLNRYFDFFQETSNEEFDAEVQRSYQQECKPIQRNAFMEVLKELGKNQKRSAALPHTREIVYTVVSSELQSNILDHLGMLEIFGSKDNLLQSDTSRYTVEIKQRLASKKEPEIQAHKEAKLVKTIELDQEVSWHEARMFNHFLLVLGKKEGIYLYCSDMDDLSGQTFIDTAKGVNKIFALPYHSTYLGITQMSILRKRFGAFMVGFDSKIKLLNLNYPSTVLAVAPINQEKIAKLSSFNEGQLHLDICDLKGNVIESYLCLDEVNQDTLVFLFYIDNEYFMNMPYRNGYLYFITPQRNTLLRIDLQGKTTCLQFPEAILKIALADEHTAPRLIVHKVDQNTGDTICSYYRPSYKEFNKCGEDFELGTSIDCLLFLGNNLIVARGNKVILYDTQGNDTPRKVGGFFINDYIIDVFKGPTSDQVGFLISGGKVVFYEISHLAA